MSTLQQRLKAIEQQLADRLAKTLATTLASADITPEEAKRVYCAVMLAPLRHDEKPIKLPTDPIAAARAYQDYVQAN